MASNIVFRPTLAATAWFICDVSVIKDIGFTIVSDSGGSGTALRTEMQGIMQSSEMINKAL